MTDNSMLGGVKDGNNLICGLHFKVKIKGSVVRQTEFFARQCPKPSTPDLSVSQPMERK